MENYYCYYCYEKIIRLQKIEAIIMNSQKLFFGRKSPCLERRLQLNYLSEE